MNALDIILVGIIVVSKCHDVVQTHKPTQCAQILTLRSSLLG